MPFSSSIREWKSHILSDLQNDDEILTALGTTDEEREDLIYKRLFPHYYIPDTITEVTTYIMVEIDIVARAALLSKSIYSYPTITFTVLAHQEDMQLNLKGISATRIDYLGELLDRKYNGASGFGIGNLELISNIAGNLNEKYRYRKLTFQGKDLSKSLCGK